MANEFAGLQEQRDRLLEAIYELGRKDPQRIAYKPAIGERLGWDIGVDPEGKPEDEAKYENLVLDLIDEGYITAESDELGMVKITLAGRRRVEGGRI